MIRVDVGVRKTKPSLAGLLLQPHTNPERMRSLKVRHFKVRGDYQPYERVQNLIARAKFDAHTISA
jgi:hypothetical protein